MKIPRMPPSSRNEPYHYNSDADDARQRRWTALPWNRKQAKIEKDVLAVLKDKPHFVTQTDTHTIYAYDGGEIRIRLEDPEAERVRAKQMERALRWGKAHSVAAGG